MSVNAIITTRKINKDLFKRGAPYQVCIATNDYRTMLVKECNDDSLTLIGYYPEEKEIVLEVSDLMYNNKYGLTPLQPDYEHKIGK
jgi:hypothetical protein